MTNIISPIFLLSSVDVEYPNGKLAALCMKQIAHKQEMCENGSQLSLLLRYNSIDFVRSPVSDDVFIYTSWQRKRTRHT